MSSPTDLPVVTVPVGGHPMLIAISPDGHRAYLADRDSDSVVVIDTAPNKVIASIPVPAHSPIGVAIAPDGLHGYVTVGAQTVCVIDTSSDEISGTFSLSGFPMGIAITPDGHEAYVACPSLPGLLVIDLADNTVSGPAIDTQGAPVGIAITPDGRAAYLTNEGAGTVRLIETTTNQLTSVEIVVGGDPFGLAVTPDGRHLLVVNTAASSVDVGGKPSISVIDVATNQRRGRSVAVGGGAVGIAITPDGLHAYVTHETGSVNVIRTEEILGAAGL